MKFPKNVPLLCKRICCGLPSIEEQLGFGVTDDGHTDQDHSRELELEGGISRSPALEFAQFSIRTISGSLMVADKGRPNDVLSFFADDRWVIDDTIAAATNGQQDDRQVADTEHSDAQEVNIRYEGDEPTVSLNIPPFVKLNVQREDPTPTAQTSEPIWPQLHDIGIRE